MKRSDIDAEIVNEVMCSISDEFLENNVDRTVIVLKDTETKKEIQLDYILSQAIFKIVKEYYNDCFEEDLKEFEELKEKQEQESEGE